MPLDWGIPFFKGAMLLAILLAVAWEVVWKGVALWKAGRNARLVWFICLFIFNTLGILPIIYIFAFSRRKE